MSEIEGEHVLKSTISMFNLMIHVDNDRLLDDALLQHRQPAAHEASVSPDGKTITFNLLRCHQSGDTRTPATCRKMV